MWPTNFSSYHLRLVGLLVFLASHTAFCQPKSGLRPPETLSPSDAEQQGRALVADLLAQHPEQNSTNTGVMRIRDSKGTQREVPVRFAVISHPTAWLNTYEASPVGNMPGEKLTILHSGAQPNQYTVAPVFAGKADTAAPRKISDNQTMVPFAGSDFWVADLGLDFLHWPKQLLVKKEMRRSRSCNVLDSINPQPIAGGYSRVRCWLDIESGGIVMAEAYDARDRLLKEFAPKEMKKIQGEWQLEEMEIRNVQAGSKTRVVFDLGH